MRIIHVEKFPYPNRDFTTDHWSVELDHQDLGLKAPTNPHEAWDIATKLVAYAKYLCLTAMWRDGIISGQEVWLLMGSHTQVLVAMGLVGGENELSRDPAHA